eukprot:984923-Amphidinium_carterae.4
MANGVQSAKLYYCRAEDVSMEFVPEYNGQKPANINLLQWVGQPMGVWNMDDWHRIDTSAQSTPWMDHSASAWANTARQWHLDDVTAVTMLNTRSMSTAFLAWCDNNGANGVLNKADGTTIKPQCVTADNGMEHDHKQAMSLHRWHRDNQFVLNNQQMTTRINNALNGAELQWTSPVTILHSSITMTVENLQ